jgi:fumarylpyruvate hydrolase
MDYAFPLPAGATLPVDGTGLVVPVRRIYCVGRNYAAHAREMGSDPDREPPFFFMKPADAIVPSGSAIPFPLATVNLQHEIELVVVIGRGGQAIAPGAALDHVYGYAVGLDMTRRDLQNEAKKTGRPWDMGKGFDQSAPCSAVRPASRIGHPAKGAIWVRVNGQVRQSGDLAQQIWSVSETIAYLSGLVTVAPGDLVFTGTPDGVGSVQPGDRLEGGIDGVGDLVVTYR